MKNFSLSFPQLSIFTLLILLTGTPALAQRIEPDEQIKREMTAYAADIEAALDASRPRVSYKAASDRLRAADKSSSPAHFALERRAFDIVNEQRAGRGLKPLRWSEDAARAARLHSENMARYKFFSHTGQDGSTVGKRARSLGIGGFQAIGENIAFNRGFRKPVEMACQHWMASTGHRENILDSYWTESGIGVAVGADGSHYFTQVFITR